MENKADVTIEEVSELLPSVVKPLRTFGLDRPCQVEAVCEVAAKQTQWEDIHDAAYRGEIWNGPLLLKLTLNRAERQHLRRELLELPQLLT